MLFIWTIDLFCFQYVEGSKDLLQLAAAELSGRFHTPACEDLIRCVVVVMVVMTAAATAIIVVIVAAAAATFVVLVFMFMFVFMAMTLAMTMFMFRHGVLL